MNLPDLRQPLARTQDWVATLIEGVRSDQLALPTPCPDFDVRALIAHLYLGAGRVQAMGEGRPADSVSTPEELPADLVNGYRRAVRAAQQAWPDEDSLSRMVQAPWGTVPGAIAIGGYLTEALAHGWDLATATGQPSEVDPELAQLALSVAQRAIPAEGRDQMPFGDVVPSRPDAPVGERFVNWMGRG